MFAAHVPDAMRSTAGRTLNVAGAVPGFVTFTVTLDAELLTVCRGTACVSKVAALQAAIAALALRCCFFNASDFANAATQSELRPLEGSGSLSGQVDSSSLSAILKLPHAHSDDFDRLLVFSLNGLFDVLFCCQRIDVRYQDIGHVGDHPG